MKQLVLIAMLGYTTAIAGEPPPHAMIDEAYFVCHASRSLQGGIFGKGPMRKFGKQPGDCSANEWQRISRQEFKTRASEWYSVRWESDIPFFATEGEARQKP